MTWQCARGSFRSLCTLFSLAACAAGLFTAAPASSSTAASNAASSSAAGATASADELKELRQRIDSLKKDLAATEGNRTEAADSLRESERAISEANRTLRNLSQDRQGAEKRLQDLGRRSRDAKQEADIQSQKLARLVHDQYVARERGYLQMLFSGENPATAARELHYASYASRAEARLIDQLRTALKELQRLSGEARDRTIELADIEARQKVEREQLARESEARRKVMRELSTKIRAQRKEVTTLEQNEKRLGQLIERLARMTRPAEKPRRAGERTESLPDSGFKGAFASLRGKLRFPIRGELAGRFGSPREDGGTIWKGIFIKAPPGEDVKAIAPGRVVFADWMRGFGNLLILDHGAEYLSIYGNNETIFKQPGEIVSSGDSIARVGNSGGNLETGLYFELRFKGSPFDPQSWIKR